VNPIQALQTVADLGERALAGVPLSELLDAGLLAVLDTTGRPHAH
jgi:hypothetical protein